MYNVELIALMLGINDKRAHVFLAKALEENYKPFNVSHVSTVSSDGSDVDDVCDKENDESLIDDGLVSEIGREVAIDPPIFSSDDSSNDEGCQETLVEEMAEVDGDRSSIDNPCELKKGDIDDTSDTDELIFSIDLEDRGENVSRALGITFDAVAGQAGIEQYVVSGVERPDYHGFCCHTGEGRILYSLVKLNDDLRLWDYERGGLHYGFSNEDWYEEDVYKDPLIVLRTIVRIAPYDVGYAANKFCCLRSISQLIEKVRMKHDNYAHAVYWLEYIQRWTGQSVSACVGWDQIRTEINEFINQYGCKFMIPHSLEVFGGVMCELEEVVQGIIGEREERTVIEFLQTFTPIYEIVPIANTGATYREYVEWFYRQMYLGPKAILEEISYTPTTVLRRIVLYMQEVRPNLRGLLDV